MGKTAFYSPKYAHLKTFKRKYKVRKLDLQT